MWGNFLDKGLALAEQAKKAAEDLDKQLNESVGVPAGSEVSESAGGGEDIDDALNDNWDDEGLDDVDLEPVKEAAREDSTDEAVLEGDTHDEAGVTQKGWEGEEAQFDTVEPSQEVEVDPKEGEEVADPPQKGEPLSTEDSAPLPPPAVEMPAVEPETNVSVQGGVVDPIVDEQSLPAAETEEDDQTPRGSENAAEEPVNLTEEPEPEPPVEENPLKPFVSEPPREEVVLEEPPLEPTQVQPDEGLVLEATDNAILASATEQPKELGQMVEQQTEYTKIMESKLEEMQQRLDQREEQLFSKTEQLTTVMAMHEAEKQELAQKVQNTKDEAKRRIQKAKEKVESMEQKMKTIAASQSSSADDAGKQAEMVVALREEGEKLARKQADMEAAVRSAKGEARGLAEELEATGEAKEAALQRIATLELELKSTLADLSSARQGESQAGKLDSDLRTVREESEKRAGTILTLEQEIKELKATQKELKAELDDTKKGAAVETQQERKKLRKEHNDLVADLETKLRTGEREAAVREDALRHEVDELRKRWQDAVRRADSLSVDVQSSTAPLLRQLESTNKQARARAAAWAELETQLRAELEENVISNEKLSKERSEWKTKCTRLERSTKEYETDVKQLKGDLHDKTERVQQLEHKLDEMEAVSTKMKTEWAEVERLANEGVSRVRSEMTKTVVDAEERHRSQVEQLEVQLRQELDQRNELEQQVAGLLDKAGSMFELSESAAQSPMAGVKEEAKPKRLRQSEGQAEILAGALGGFGGDDDPSDSDDEDDDVNHTPNGGGGGGGGGSFAALEQLTSRLKASKVELTTLRNRLAESEKSREELLQVLGESRNAREKLPLFEAKVQELTIENRELTQEVEGLRFDIQDVRELYRTQLNVLLEAQAVDPAPTNGTKNDHSREPVENTPAQENGSPSIMQNNGDASAQENGEAQQENGGASSDNAANQ